MDTGSGGGPIDLFFYHGLHPSAGIMTEMGDFQWTALPFGLHASPYWTGRVDQVV